MAIEFKCTCGKSMKCGEELAGRRARCTGCGREFVIPSRTIISKDFDFSEIASIIRIAIPTAEPIRKKSVSHPRWLTLSLWLIILGGLSLCSAIIVGRSLVVLPAVGRQPGGVRLIPGVKAILGVAPSSEREVVKRYALRNSLRPESITFEKWFPAKDASPEDHNAFEIKYRERPHVRARLNELDDLRDYGMTGERLQLTLNLNEKYKVMTADRVVRVITRTDAPIIGQIRTDDFYYLKDGKVVKCETGTPADQDELINLYYPGED
jgi:hypothetical protein